MGPPVSQTENEAISYQITNISEEDRIQFQGVVKFNIGNQPSRKS